MRLSLLLLLYLGFMFNSAVAQQFGIKAGINYANVNSSDDIDKDNIIRYQFGVVAKTERDGLLQGQAAILFSQRGYKINFGGLSGTNRISYIDIPLDLVLKFGLSDDSGILVLGGPYFSYAVNSRFVDSDGSILNGFKSASYNVKRFDSGFNLGAGVDFSNFRITGTYTYGLTDNGSTTSGTATNRVFVLAGALFF